jgi:hypothetical protein
VPWQTEAETNRLEVVSIEYISCFNRERKERKKERKERKERKKERKKEKKERKT